MTNKPSARGLVVAAATVQITQFEGLRGSTTMYEAFFHLRRRPFLAAPTIESYFPGQAIEHARQTLIRCIERAQGPGLVIGPAGTGKSLLCHLLADHFHSALRVAVLANSRLCTRRALLQSILFELGQRYRDMDEGELRLSLINYLEPSAECPHGVLLIVDEAHTYPTRLLEELRILTNLVRDGVPRIRLILAGGSPLEERFAGPKLESFNQRIAGRCYLQALSREETIQYVRAQLAAVDGDPDRIVAESAWSAFYRATDGVPRLINQIGDAALLLAAQSRQPIVTDSIVEQAWADLQQIPTPWQTPPLETRSSSGASSSVIEFGQLSDDLGAIASFEPHHDVRFDSQVEQFVAPQVESKLAEQPTLNRVEPVVASNDDSHATDAAATETGASWLPDIAVKVPRRGGVAPATGTVSPAATVTSAPVQATAGAAKVIVAAVPTQPAMSTAPPAVPPADELFGDDYLEEEVVIDRYASLEMMAIAERLKVSCREGREIAASLSSLTTPLARRTSSTGPATGGPTTAFTSLAAESRAAFGITGPTEVQSPEVVETYVQPIVAVSDSGPLLAAEVATDEGLASLAAATSQSIITGPPPESCVSQLCIEAPATEEPTVPTPTTEVHVAHSPATEVHAAHSPTQGAAVRMRPHVRVAATDDRDLLVVEDDGSSHAPVDPEQGRARRQEYRSLFARLRART